MIYKNKGDTQMAEQQIIIETPLPNPAVLSEQQVREGELEQCYTRRIRPHTDLVYEFTHDPALLQQYYAVRQRLYTEKWGLEHFPEGPEDFDKRGMILVVRSGKLVVGGVRMLIRSPRINKPLQIEADGINLQEYLPQLQLEHNSYCEISRLALLPEFRGIDTSICIYRVLKRKAVAHKVKYGFVLAPYSQIRNYRLMSKIEGEDYVTCENVPIPDHDDFEGIRMTLSYFVYPERYEGEDEYGQRIVVEAPLEA